MSNFILIGSLYRRRRRYGEVSWDSCVTPELLRRTAYLHIGEKTPNLRDSWICRTGICRIGKWRTKSHGWNLQEWRMMDDPCDFVRHFPVCKFHPVFWWSVDFPVLQIPVTVFSTSTFCDGASQRPWDKIEYCAQLQTFPYSTISKPFLNSDIFMAILLAQHLPFISAKDKQKIQHFRPTGGVRNSSPTLLSLMIKAAILNSLNRYSLPEAQLPQRGPRDALCW